MSLKLEEHGREMTAILLCVFVHVCMSVRVACGRFLDCDRHLCLDLTQGSEVVETELCFKCLQAHVSTPVCGRGQYIVNFCHSIFLLQTCSQWSALNHVYNRTGSKRGQQHN